MKQKILFVAMCLPFDKAGHAGGKTFNYYINKFAQDDFEVKLISKVLPDEERFLKTINPLIDVYPVATPKSKIRKSLAYIKSLNSKLNPWYKYGNTLTKEIYDQIYRRLLELKEKGYVPDIIILEWTSMLLYIDKVKKVFPKAVYVASEHDVTFLGYERKMQKATNPVRKAYWKAAYETMKRNELASIIKCNLVVTHNEKDKKLLLANGIDEGKLGVISPYYEKFQSINRKPNNQDIIFYGAMNRIENSESAIWFIENVMPKLEKYAIKFVIIGNKPPQKLVNMQNERIKVTGFVENPAPYFERAICLVAPLLLGAGVKVKVIEALSSGVPVLTNDIGIEGIDAVAGQDYFLCKTPEEYSQRIIDILTDKVDVDRMAMSAQQLIEEKYNLERSYRQYKERILGL